MPSKAELKITTARIRLISKHDFVGVLAMQLNLIEDEKLNPPTLATDGKNLYFHPDWVMNADPTVLQAGVGHEVFHCMLRHCERRAGRNAQKWNIAIDYVVNGMLAEIGFNIPKEWIHDPKYAGKGADEIYNLLPDMPEGQRGGGGTGKQPFDAHDKLVAAGDADKSLGDQWQQAAISAVAAVDASKSSRAHGSVPGYIRRMVTQLLAPKVDWKSVTRRWWHEQTRTDYSWSRPNRKMLALGYILPGIGGEGMGETVTIIDTSGSIGEKELTEFGSEVAGLRDEAAPSKLYNIYADAEINHVDVFTPGEEFFVAPHGGGGTDFRPAFNWIEENGVKPACAIYLTDGYGDYPSEPPPYPVLWVLNTDYVPPWGEYVRMDNKEN